MNGFPSPSPLGSEVVHQERPLLTLLSPIPYHDAGAIDHLSRITLAVQHACFTPNTRPLISLNSSLSDSFHAKKYVTQIEKKRGQLTQPGPLAQQLAVADLNQRDRMLPAQRLDELLVRFLLTRLVEHAHVRLSPVERLGGFAEAAGETVVDEGELQGAFEGFVDGLARGGG